MCARYYMEESPELRPYVEAMNRSPLLAAVPPGAKTVTSGEVRPGDVPPVFASDRRGAPAVFPMRWGFAGRTLLINARSETAAERPTFADAWARHRCALPASYFFEWEHLPDAKGGGRTGDKYRLRPAGADLVWLCGLYRLEEGFPHFVILTRQSAEGIRFIHDRMPLMLPDSAIREWIRPDGDPGLLAASALTDLEYEPAV